MLGSTRKWSWCVVQLWKRTPLAMTSVMVAADLRSTGKLSWGVVQLWRPTTRKLSWCMRRTVVKKGTVSYDVSHCSRRSEINWETISMRRTTVVKNDKVAISDVGSAERRGFQHVYTLRNTTSSRRVRSAYNSSIQNGYPQSKQAMKRNKAKKKKIDSLLVVASSPEHSLCKAFFLSSRPTFYSGTLNTKAILPRKVENPIVMSVMENLQIVDTLSGSRLESTSGDTVFTLIPWHAAINKLTHVNRTITSLYALEDAAQTMAEVRGKSRLTIVECERKNTTVGLKQNRGGPGITDSWPKKLSISAWKRICNLWLDVRTLRKG